MPLPLRCFRDAKMDGHSVPNTSVLFPGGDSAPGLLNLVLLQFLSLFNFILSESLTLGESHGVVLELAYDGVRPISITNGPSRTSRIVADPARLLVGVALTPAAVRATSPAAVTPSVYVMLA